MDKTTDPPIAEAERWVKAEFHVESASQRTSAIHKAECGIDIKISGLKKDLKTLLNLPAAEQIWTLRSRVLHDNQTLAYYGLTGTEMRGIQILVKRGH